MGAAILVQDARSIQRFSGKWGGLPDKPVSCTADGFNRCVFAEFFAQVANVHVHDAVDAHVIVPPYLIQQRPAAKDLAGGAHER